MVVNRWWERRWLAWSVIFGTGLVFDLVLNTFQVQWLIWDSRWYHYQALATPTPFSYRPFGYAAIIRAVSGIVGPDYFGSLFFLQAILNSLNGVLVFGLLLLITERPKVAWVGGLLVALCPFTAGYTSSVLTETAATFLLTATIFLSVLIIKRPHIYFYYILLGLTSVVLLEVRYNFEVYLVVPFALIIIGTPFKLIKRLKNLALAGLLIAIIMLPPVLFNYRAFQEFVLFTRTDNLTYSLMLDSYFDHGHWFRSLVDMDTAAKLQSKYPLASSELDALQDPADPTLASEVTRQLKGYVKDYFAADSGKFALRTVAHLWDEWNQTYLYPYSMPLPDFLSYGIFSLTLNRLYLLFLVGGVFYVFRYKILALPIVSALLYLWLIQALFAVESRYMLPFYPVMLGLVALSLSWIGNCVRLWWATRRTREKASPWKAWLAIPVITAGLIIFLSTAIDSTTYQAYTFNLQLEATDNVFLTINLPYYAAHSSQLVNELQAMQTLPEVQIPAEKAALDSRLAGAYLYNGEFNQSVEAATEAISINPTDYRAYHWRSAAWLKLGRPDLAQQDDTKFRQLAPPDDNYTEQLNG